MLNEKTRADTDQAVASACEMYPPLWYGIYSGCVDQGFTPDQAIYLVKTYIKSMGTNNQGENNGT